MTLSFAYFELAAAVAVDSGCAEKSIPIGRGMIPLSRPWRENCRFAFASSSFLLGAPAAARRVAHRVQVFRRLLRPVHWDVRRPELGAVAEDAPQPLLDERRREPPVLRRLLRVDAEQFDVAPDLRGAQRRLQSTCGWWTSSFSNMFSAFNTPLRTCRLTRAPGDGSIHLRSRSHAAVEHALPGV